MSNTALQLLREWTDFMIAEGKSDRTRQAYRYAVLRFLSETSVDSVSAISEQDVVVFLASLGKKAHSRQLYLQALRSFFGWAKSREKVKLDPTEHLRPKAPPKKEPDAYTPEELALLVAAARKRSERRANTILVAYALGLRRSELCGIRPDDVDWQGRRVYIREAKGDRPRWVEMNEIASEALKELAQHKLKDYSPTLNSGDSNSRLPLVGYAPQWFTMIVHQAASEAGFPPGRRNAHLLRSSFATHLIGNGVAVPVVSRLLGHQNLSTTQRYVAIRAGDRRQAVDSLALA